jgi:hypothetical protein
MNDRKDINQFRSIAAGAMIHLSSVRMTVEVGEDLDLLHHYFSIVSDHLMVIMTVVPLTASLRVRSRPLRV